jgi:hypothetical protein
MTVVPETPLTHTERARLALEHIRGLKELIGGFTFVAEADPRTLNAAKSVSDAFLEMTAVAIEASEELAQSSRVTPAELRDAAVFSLAFAPVAKELGMMHQAVSYTIAVRRSGVATLALQAYQMGKALVRKTIRPVLIPHLENMKLALGKGRSKATAAKTPDVSKKPDRTGQLKAA